MNSNYVYRIFLYKYNNFLIPKHISLHHIMFSTHYAYNLLKPTQAKIYCSV